MDNITSALSTSGAAGGLLSNVSSVSPACFNREAKMSVVATVVYVLGILGNAAAIVMLRRGNRRVQNRKYLLLLTSLAANDLVALTGMLCTMVVGAAVAGVQHTRAFCAARVVMRVFGIGSVCIAVTMALERYLALTRPFLYQKQVTYYVIRTMLLVSWCLAAALTCAPVLGFGYYYDEAHGCCTRYRNATSTKDFAYAVFYVLFGTTLSLVLVYCNLAVVRALYATRGGGWCARPARPELRRCVSRQRSVQACAGAAPPLAPQHNAATHEEVAFSRLMTMLSILFIICWMPQMLTSTLYLSLGPRHWARLAPLGLLSDLLILLNFVVNPVVYVLMRVSRRWTLASLCHSVAHCFKRGHKTSTESMKTTCCPQESTLASDTSIGAELRPLRLQPEPMPVLAEPCDCPRVTF